MNMDEMNVKKGYHFFERFKKDKKTVLIVSVALMGFILIFLSELIPDNKNTEQNKYEQNLFVGSSSKSNLEEIISKVQGVGKVSVMVTYEGSEENIYAINESEQVNENDVKTNEEYLVIDKGSVEEGLLLKKIYPRVAGVAVVCEGGGNPAVKNEITNMLKALYSISSTNINISEMNG